MLKPESLEDDLQEPLIDVASINAKPYWGQLLRGKARFREVIIDSPECVFPVEVLAHLAAGMNNEAVAVSDEPEVKPAAVQKNEKSKAKPKEKLQTKSDTLNPKPKKPAKKKEAKKPQEVKKPERPPAGLPMRVSVKGASVRVVSETKDADLFSITGIEFDLPVFGEDEEGEIKLGEIKVPGMQAIQSVRQKVEWKRPYLQMGQENLALGGVNMKWGAQMGLSRGLPFLVDVVIEPQTIEHVELLDRVALDVKAENLSGRFQAAGSMTKPMSWRSSMVMLSNNITVSEKHGGRQLHFDELSLPAIFQQGQLNWQSARVVGEDVAFLGNGQISFRHGANTVTRLVVSPEVAAELHSAMVGAGLVNWRGWWKDLDTPDRKYRDLHVRGNLKSPSIDLSSKHEDLPLWQTLAEVLDFIRVEMSEEGVALQPLPNEEIFNN